MIGTNNNANFRDNRAPFGQTIYMTFSDMQTSRMYFLQNGGENGACYLLDSNSSLKDIESKYEKNSAT